MPAHAPPQPPPQQVHAPQPAPMPAQVSSPSGDPAAPAAHEPVQRMAAAGLLLVQGDNPAAESVAQLLKQLAIEPVIVHDGGDGSKVLDALERRGHLSVAIVLLDPSAPDGGAPSGELLFHLGYCVGRMGAKRLTVMHPVGRAALNHPSGIVHIAMDAGGGWQLQLGKQLRKAGLSVDLNKLA
jgi:hypothetical protein